MTMDILVSDTPPCCQAGSSVTATGHPLGMWCTWWFGCTYVAFGALSEAATQELRYRGGWRREAQLTQHAQRARARERQTNRQAASIPFSPASGQMISQAHTQRCSSAQRGTSWCLPFYPGAPTRSCGEAGVREGWDVGWKRANPYQVVTMATSLG